jgi:outer membrane protein assembly factor BamB
MSWRLRWIVVAPVVLFVALTVAMSSCGGSSGCNGSFDAFGNFQAGVCPSPGPGLGFQLETIVIGAGTPAPPTPTPGPTATGRHPTPSPTGSIEPTPIPTATPTFKGRTATPTPSLVPQASSTTIAKGQQALFNADGLFVKHQRTIVADITNSSSTLWTSSNQNVLAPPQPPPFGGIFSGVAPSGGCACAGVSSGGISADPISVGVEPLPSGGCPACPTIGPTATSTPKGGGAFIPAETRSVRDTARVGGVLQWTFQAASLITSPLRPSSDGNLYFLTFDGNLHALNAKGRELWSRGASGSSLAVAPDGTIYALGNDGSLHALSPIGKPLWNIQVGSSVGPLAASSSVVYLPEDRQLFAVTSSGATQWRATVTDQITSAALADDGSVVVAANGGSIMAFATDGSRRWSFAPQGGFAGEIAVRDNLVYLGSGSGRLYALDAANGAPQWSYNTAAAVGGGPVLNPAGPIFFGSDAVYALNLDGSMAWSKPLTKPALQPLASDGEGGVLSPLDDGGAVMLNSDGSVRWATRSFGVFERAVVSPAGVLYVARQGTIYAVK